MVIVYKYRDVFFVSLLRIKNLVEFERYFYSGGDVDLFRDVDIVYNVSNLRFDKILSNCSVLLRGCGVEVYDINILNYIIGKRNKNRFDVDFRSFKDCLNKFKRLIIFKFCLDEEIKVEHDVILDKVFYINDNVNFDVDKGWCMENGVYDFFRDVKDKGLYFYLDSDGGVRSNLEGFGLEEKMCYFFREYETEGYSDLDDLVIKIGELRDSNKSIFYLGRNVIYFG